MENLLTAKLITFEEYVKALDDDSMINKPKLEKLLKDRKEEEKQMQQIQMQANAISSSLNQVMEEENQIATDNEIQNIANIGEQIAGGQAYAV